MDTAIQETNQSESIMTESTTSDALLPTAPPTTSKAVPGAIPIPSPASTAPTVIFINSSQDAQPPPSTNGLDFSEIDDETLTQAEAEHQRFLAKAEGEIQRLLKMSQEPQLETYRCGMLQHIRNSSVFDSEPISPRWATRSSSNMGKTFSLA